MNKTCKQCGETKDILFFTSRPKGFKDGYDSRCKPCVNLNAKASRDRRRSIDKEATQELDWRRNLGRVYGLTPEQWQKMYESQGGVCMYCGKPETDTLNGKVKRLAVDHDRECCDHYKSCGKCIRGLSCAFCNQLMGRVERNPDLVKLMVKMKGWF